MRRCVWHLPSGSGMYCWSLRLHTQLHRSHLWRQRLRRLVRDLPRPRCVHPQRHLHVYARLRGPRVWDRQLRWLVWDLPRPWCVYDSRGVHVHTKLHGAHLRRQRLRWFVRHLYAYGRDVRVTRHLLHRDRRDVFPGQQLLFVALRPPEQPLRDVSAHWPCIVLPRRHGVLQRHLRQPKWMVRHVSFGVVEVPGVLRVLRWPRLLVGVLPDGVVAPPVDSRTTTSRGCRAQVAPSYDRQRALRGRPRERAASPASGESLRGRGCSVDYEHAVGWYLTGATRWSS